MNPLLYIKAVVAAVGATVFPPIADWLVSFIPAPPDVRMALSIFVVALLTGGAVYKSTNQQPSNTPAGNTSPGAAVG